MSAANRSAVRRPDDFYETPSSCVDRLLEALPLPGGRWLEPSAGQGAIIRAVNAFEQTARIEWAACELRRRNHRHLTTLADVVGEDFLRFHAAPPFDVVIMNPPFMLAQEFVEHALPMARHVVALLRLNFLGSQRRAEFMRANPPDVYVLPNRPSFTGRGTDATEYAWFHWPPDRKREAGRVAILARTERR